MNQPNPADTAPDTAPGPSAGVNRPTSEVLDRTAVRQRTLSAIAEITVPATYKPGDLVTFLMTANVLATVQIDYVGETADGKTETRYLFSNGLGAGRVGGALPLWRPATDREAALYRRNAIQVGDTGEVVFDLPR